MGLHRTRTAGNTIADCCDREKRRGKCDPVAEPAGSCRRSDQGVAGGYAADRGAGSQGDVMPWINGSYVYPEGVLQHAGRDVYSERYNTFVRDISGALNDPAAGGGIPEAPTDGQSYTRRGADASWQVATSGGGGGTVTSVTGTAPVVSSGGTAPVISMPAATTSVSGHLTSTDWNTFNARQSTSEKGVANGYAPLDASAKV